MRRKLLAIILTTMIFGLAACRNSSNNKQEISKSPDDNHLVEEAAQESNPEEHDPVTLSIYTGYSDDDTKLPVDYAVEELKKEMPWVTLEIETNAQDDGQKLKTYAATGDMPDIFQCDVNLINTFVKSGNIALLNDYVSETGYDTLIQDNCRDLLYNENGDVYAFPYAGNELVLMYYNSDLFEANNIKVPATFDELLDAVKAFNELGITPISLFAQEGWITSAMYDVIATKYIPAGIKGLDTGKTDITDEGYLKAAYKLKELVDANAFAKGVTGLNYDQAASLFYQGEAAMFLNGEWFITDADANMNGSADWMVFPVTADGGDNATAVSGSGGIGGLGVSSTADDIELCAKVAAFISQKIAEYKYVERANTIVAIKVDKTFNCEVSAMTQKLADELPGLTMESSFDWGLENAKYKVTLEEQTQALIAGILSPEEFIENVGNSLE